MAQKLTVVISSTLRDLPEHRKEVMAACLDQDMFPKMMEHLPASGAEAISASLKLVDEADVYIGIIAHSYGYVPRSSRISITEMEYNRAMERGIPRLIFIVDSSQRLAEFFITNIDRDDANAQRLANFKTRLETENIVKFFRSSTDLRAYAISSLSRLRYEKFLEENPADLTDNERHQQEYLISRPSPEPKVGARTVNRRAPPSNEGGEKNAAIGGAKKGAKKR
jgi:hypothetical protein